MHIQFGRIRLDRWIGGREWTARTRRDRKAAARSFLSQWVSQIRFCGARREQGRSHTSSPQSTVYLPAKQRTRAAQTIAPSSTSSTSASSSSSSFRFTPLSPHSTGASRASNIPPGQKRSHSHLNLYSHVQHTRDYECVGLMKAGEGVCLCTTERSAVDDDHRHPGPIHSLPVSFLSRIYAGTTFSPHPYAVSSFSTFRVVSLGTARSRGANTLVSVLFFKEAARDRPRHVYHYFAWESVSSLASGKTWTRDSFLDLRLLSQNARMTFSRKMTFPWKIKVDFSSKFRGQFLLMNDRWKLIFNELSYPSKM